MVSTPSTSIATRVISFVKTPGPYPAESDGDKDTMMALAQGWANFKAVVENGTIIGKASIPAPCGVTRCVVVTRLRIGPSVRTNSRNGAFAPSSSARRSSSDERHC